MNRRTNVAVAVVSILAIVGAVFTIQHRRTTAKIEGNEQQKIKYAEGIKVIEAAFPGFFQQESGRQCASIENALNVTKPPQKTIQAAIEIASNSACTPLVRNQAAIYIGTLENVPEWRGKLLEMIKNDDEDALWRDYAVQHFSDEIGKATGDKSLMKELQGIYQNIPVLSATALMQMDRLERERSVDFGLGYIDGAVESVLQLKEPEERLIVTALAIVPLRNLRTAIPSVRVWVVSKNLAVRCTAIATLGELRSSADLDLLRELTKDPEPRVRDVAQASLNVVSSNRKVN